MREVFDQSGVRVFEDTLERSDLVALQAWAEGVRYRGVHADHWHPVWRLGDGEPLRGPTWLTSSDEATASDPQARSERERRPSALEPLAEALRALLLVGPDHGARVSMTPWIYPRGTGLGLHRDDGHFAGSYVFYFVREWDVHWGGLLNCVVEPHHAGTNRAVFDATMERASLSSTGPGVWIPPACNRLVVLAPHVRHWISRVDANAGDQARLSIGGFVHVQ